ncbi:hypothetical protein ABW22_01435 [Thiobacillus denitrificans]|uniref:Uncharacterized protein n=2 Tax=Thiobacillus denitrificans TaxID=36861 RepID=A0A119CY97_THIDE|nr:hypothetical protein ABW22_01435 [Thiobacillus denitrificans]
MYGTLADLIVKLAGYNQYQTALPAGKNMFSNADLSASTSGLATGISIASIAGTSVNTIVERAGVNAQQFDWTPGNVDGTDSHLTVDITVSAAGAAPFVPVSVGDVLGIEFDLLVDDGAGGAPNVYNTSVYLRKTVGATPTIINNAISFFSGGPKTYYQEKVDTKLVGGLIQIDEATTASSGAIVARLVIVGITQTTPVRVIISNVRAVKLPLSWYSGTGINVNATAGRALNTTYNNNTISNKLVQVSARCVITLAAGSATIQGKSDTTATPVVVASPLVGIQSGLLNEDNTSMLTMVVAPGANYRIDSVVANGTATLGSWFETVL